MQIAGLHSLIDEDRLSGWAERFRFYREPPSRAQVENWVLQFKSSEQVMAAKVLDSVEIISERDILEAFRRGLNAIPGWHSQARQRQGNWVFVGFGRAGESGPAMLGKFREANRLASRQFDHLFAEPSELPGRRLTAKDTVVFVDDIAGSGQQAIQFWPTTKELIASQARCFLLLVAATDGAIDKIGSLEDLVLIADRSLGNAANIFHAENSILDEAEKRVLLRYCRKLDPKNPKGFGGCGLTLVLQHKTPNNTIPVLHRSTNDWRPIFPRYLMEDAA